MEGFLKYTEVMMKQLLFFKLVTVYLTNKDYIHRYRQGLLLRK